ncbi:MAG: hypothetical protein K6E92_10785 [Lachnospiraceae bacterium]|nr:hypothetical protein [Lachnospiraceae bacterium]
MTVLLEIREKIKEIYSRIDAFLIPFVRFLLAFIVLRMINDRLGYMTRLDNTALVLIASLLCAVLPGSMILFLAAVFSLAHIYALSLEVAAVTFVLYLLVYLLYLRFAPKESLVVALTPVLFALHIPYVVPIVMGLVGTPASAVSVACGILVYFLLATVTGNATNIGGMDSDEAIAKFRLVIDSLMGNKQMLVLIVAFAVVTIVVCLIRRLSIEHAWTIAIIAGVVMNVMILLVGDLIYDAGFSFGSVILGSLLAVVVAKVLEFFRFCVDYSRTERVQFEDEEYYYYVKAVPKMMVPRSERTVKRINRSSNPEAEEYGRRSRMQEEEEEYYPEDDDVEVWEDDYEEEEYYEDEGDE